MKLRDLVHVLWARTVSVMSPEITAAGGHFDTFRGEVNGLDSAISYACEKYGDKDVDCICFTGYSGVTISLY